MTHTLAITDESKPVSLQEVVNLGPVTDAVMAHAHVRYLLPGFDVITSGTLRRFSGDTSNIRRTLIDITTDLGVEASIPLLVAVEMRSHGAFAIDR